MSGISQYGVLGAFIGLVIGLLDFVLLDRLLYPRLREKHEFAKTRQTQGVDPNVIMGAIKVACFTVFPIVGYIVGSEFAQPGL